MSFRVQRINSEMLKAIVEIIRNRIKDPRVSEMVSVMDVDVAKDLKTAKVYVSIYGDKEKAKSTFAALINCAGFVRHELSIDFKDLRIVPEIRFILDETMEYSQKISEKLEEIKRNDNN